MQLFPFYTQEFRYYFYLLFVYLSFTIIAIQKINYNNNYFWKTTARCLSVSLESYAVHCVLKLTPRSSSLLHSFIVFLSPYFILLPFLFLFLQCLYNLATLNHLFIYLAISIACWRNIVLFFFVFVLQVFVSVSVLGVCVLFFFFTIFFFVFYSYFLLLCCIWQ